MRWLMVAAFLLGACGGDDDEPGFVSDAADDTALSTADAAPDMAPDAAPLPENETVCDDGDDDDGDGDIDCDDPDCEQAVRVGGACINPGDLGAYRDIDLNVEWNKCVVGENCIADIECNTPCFSANIGLTEPCARCFAVLVSCIFSECSNVCGGGGGSRTCLACIAAQCLPDYQNCFGQPVCAIEYGCRDGFDNDNDGDVDGRDLDCLEL